MPLLPASLTLVPGQGVPVPMINAIEASFRLVVETKDHRRRATMVEILVGDPKAIPIGGHRHHPATRKEMCYRRMAGVNALPGKALRHLAKSTH